jgi:hypothetical protein
VQRSRDPKPGQEKAKQSYDAVSQILINAENRHPEGKPIDPGLEARIAAPKMIHQEGDILFVNLEVVAIQPAVPGLVP